MKITFTIKQLLVIGVIIALVFGLFYLGGIRYRRQIDRLNTAIYMGQDTIRKQAIEIAKQKINVYYAQAAVVHTQEALKEVAREREYLKKLRITDIKTISNLKLEVEVLKKQGEYGVVTVDDDTYDDNEIILDNIGAILAVKDTVRYAKYRDEWVWANVWLYPDRPQFDLGVHTLPLRIDVGYQGFWKDKPVAVVSSPNPYVILKDNNTIIIDNKKWYHKRWPWAVAGGVAGFFIGR